MSLKTIGLVVTILGGLLTAGYTAFQWYDGHKAQQQREAEDALAALDTQMAASTRLVQQWDRMGISTMADHSKLTSAKNQQAQAESLYGRGDYESSREQALAAQATLVSLDPSHSRTNLAAEYQAAYDGTEKLKARVDAGTQRLATFRTQSGASADAARAQALLEQAKQHLQRAQQAFTAKDYAGANVAVQQGDGAMNQFDVVLPLPPTTTHTRTPAPAAWLAGLAFLFAARRRRAVPATV